MAEKMRPNPETPHDPSIKEFKIEFMEMPIFLRLAETENSKAVIVVVHGLGEHSGRYLEEVVPALRKASCGVLLYDQIGHGRSGGKRGHCPGYRALLDLLGKVIDKAAEILPNKPIFLYGHSMGGNLTLNYAMRRRHELKGLMVTSPYLKLAFQPPAWKMLMGKLLLWIAPSVTVPSGLDPNGISSIPEEVVKYKTDPLVHNRVSPVFTFPVMEAGEWAIANADLLSANTLLFHGEEDPIIDPAGTLQFHNAANVTSYVSLKGYHELHHDRCRQKLFNTIQNWLSKQL